VLAHQYKREGDRGGRGGRQREIESERDCQGMALGPRLRVDARLQTTLKHTWNQDRSADVSTSMLVSPSTLRSRHVSAGQDDKSRVTTTKWRIFLNSCLEARLPLVRFEATAKLLYRTHRIQSSKLSDVLRDTQTDSGASIDPLLPGYAAKLLQLDILHTPSLVATVIKCLCARTRTDGELELAVDSTLRMFSPQLELCLLDAAIKHSQSHGFAKSRQGTMVLLKQIRILTSSLSHPELIEATKVPESQPSNADAAAMIVAAGNWTLTVFENGGIAAEVHDVLSDGMSHPHTPRKWTDSGFR
jgi:hypothetical protein